MVKLSYKYLYIADNFIADTFSRNRVNICLKINLCIADTRIFLAFKPPSPMAPWLSGKFPPGKVPPGKFPPGKLPPGNFPPRKSPPRKSPPWELGVRGRNPSNPNPNNPNPSNLNPSNLNPTIMCKNYWENCEKRPSVASHKQFKTLLRANMVKLKIISLYIYKDLRLRILGLMSHVTIITRMAT